MGCEARKRSVWGSVALYHTAIAPSRSLYSRFGAEAIETFLTIERSSSVAGTMICAAGSCRYAKGQESKASYPGSHQGRVQSVLHPGHAHRGCPLRSNGPLNREQSHQATAGPATDCPRQAVQLTDGEAPHHLGRSTLTTPLRRDRSRPRRSRDAMPSRSERCSGAFFAEMAREARAFGGTVEKYAGDTTAQGRRTGP